MRFPFLFPLPHEADSSDLRERKVNLLLDDWVDPFEQALRAGVHEFVQALLEAEVSDAIDSAAVRPAPDPLDQPTTEATAAAHRFPPAQKARR